MKTRIYAAPAVKGLREQVQTLNYNNCLIGLDSIAIEIGVIIFNLNLDLFLKTKTMERRSMFIYKVKQ